MSRPSIWSRSSPGRFARSFLRGRRRRGRRPGRRRCGSTSRRPCRSARHRAGWRRSPRPRVSRGCRAPRRSCSRRPA
ncbi:MAG TPA: hypothetical protein DD417_04525 [Elusimicrobia bacterium]|nr:hypothetical protein [Elusimicrobiota bacterium]